ncbi:hypothetical protein DFJ63DRAFT_341463 [Scheffersomyces coipomensis]|uniref:uncharacterized protein n=1 Tax=Scheffersomyces coipomensis TaxID=1788519 RepID=UPI00315D6D8C
MSDTNFQESPSGSSPSKNVKNLSISTPSSSSDKHTTHPSSTNVAAPIDLNVAINPNSNKSVTPSNDITPATDNTIPVVNPVVFKVPKKILVPTPVPESKEQTKTPVPTEPIITSSSATVASQTNSNNSSNAPSVIASPAVPAATSSTIPPSQAILNKTTINNINKSLKAKQKVINSREPLKTPVSLISDSLTTSPQTSIFPNNISSVNIGSHDVETIDTTINKAHENNTTSTGTSKPIINPSSTANVLPPQPPSSSAPILLNPNNSALNLNHSISGNINPNISNVSQNSELPIGESNQTTQKKPDAAKAKRKKIPKQPSTRTDFFAAKLATAVDEVESSDSDETFVYENNNSNDFENINVPGNFGDTNSIHGSIMTNPVQISALTVPQDQNEDKVPKASPINNTATQPLQPPSNRPPSITNSFSSNHYIESIGVLSGNNSSRDKRPVARQQSFSSYSHDDVAGKNQFPSERSSNNHSPYIDGPPINEIAVPTKRYQSTTNSQIARSISDGYNDDNFSYNEVDDDDENLIDDEMSTDGDYFTGQKSNNATLTNASGIHTQPQPQSHQSQPSQSQPQQQSSQQQHLQQSVVSNAAQSVSSKAGSKKNYKSSTSSSKLRSTTSKLFDKKGSQPRRYSIIPDDIDIEDFDDELIYYDNNIRFPYNGSTNNLHETTPLMNQPHQPQQHRLPHYRSLNLNFPGSKKEASTLKNKRYLSTGQPLVPDNGGTASPNAPNNEVYPFPYQDQSQPNYYYDFDEYDEEGNEDFRVNLGGGRNNGKNGLYSSQHFFLPRKQSGEFDNYRVNCIKSFIYTLISIVSILSIGFIMGFVLATTKDLTNVSITSIENAVVSQDELIFNIVVQAFNPGWFTVDIEDVELDIFAKSGYLPDSLVAEQEDMESLASNVVTVLLGSVLTLESPMSFRGGFFNRDPIYQSGEIKLFSPGKNLTNILALANKKDKEKKNKDDGNSTDPDNSKKWEIISKNPFDLVVRGLLKYNLPMSIGKNTKSVVVDKTGFIDPTQFTYINEANNEKDKSD